jgi:phosphoglycolate phosphatase
MKKLSQKQIKTNIAIDLDGTLLDSSKRHVVLLREILKSQRIKLKLNDYMSYKRDGKSTKDYLVSKGLDINTTDEICKKWVKNIENIKLLKLDKLYKDSKEFLEKYYRKYNLILITGRSNRKTTKEQINSLGISKFFKKIKIVKPTKDISEKKTKLVQKYKCFAIIGDTETEKYVSDSLKIKLYPICRGFRSKEYWSNLNIIPYSSLKEINL